MYSVIIVEGRQHVLCEAQEREVTVDGVKIPNANYMGTGKALCGVVDKNDTLLNWMDKNHK